ncbi:hypothetical protein PENTCL1PPCAC_30575 [Pristionchus entomophagus]|uniref:Hexosyltransferase n=1 Tax=Pristionchus entomophagus TaxID=358040 RepID=A0AAV5UMU8_9BILA|nr:hypothetical protein PENTCL1PPCAC_20905 [Pristionchus entomophagus]GMT08401.1 hypothetical protein PENTCL1PPCAC_30575 [Pristionchus entomophagus]
METHSKILVGALIFLPAFLYFLIAINNSPVIPRSYVRHIDPIDFVFVIPPKGSRNTAKAVEFACELNQNIMMQEYMGLHLARDLST